MLACDIVLAGRRWARFDSRFLQIGLHPGGGHTWRLEHATDLPPKDGTPAPACDGVVGAHQCASPEDTALKVRLDAPPGCFGKIGEVLSDTAEDAHRTGLQVAWQVVDDDGLLDRARE